jgi:enoyl-[acyl-carrier-protein] reductase (NADH)
MPDIAVISGILSSIKTASDIAKLIKDAGITLDEAEQKLKLATLVDSLVEARTQLAKVREEIVRKNEIIFKLEKELEYANKFDELLLTLTFNSPFYISNENQELYCPKRIEGDRKAIHLVKTANLEMRRRVWACPQCKTNFTDMRDK